MIMRHDPPDSRFWPPWGHRFVKRVFAGASLAGLLVAPALGGPKTDPTGPNTVVLVTVDTLRADSVSFMGCERPTSPFIDSLAALGVVFDRAYSTSSWTVPAIASIFTSRYPSSHGVVRGEIIGTKSKEVWQQTALSPELDTMAELFRRAGYRTVGVAANRHLQVGSGFEHGFDHYYGYAGFLGAEELNVKLRETMASAFGPEWRKTWKQQKTFLWIHYFDPHHPYFPKEPWIETFDPEYVQRPEAFPWRLKAPELNAAYSPSDTAMKRRLLALYHSEVGYTDRALRAAFADLGLDGEVPVIFVSDHGEEFGEHGGIGHRRTLNEEVVQVPMFISWPSRFPAGKRVENVVSVVDLLPTVVELASLPSPDGVEGRSLVPLVNGSDGGRDRSVYLELHPPNPSMRALVNGHWKLVTGSHNQPALYNLQADPGENKDVAADQAQLANRFASELETWLQSLPKPPAAVNFSSRDQSDIEKLRAIGYVEE